MAGVHACEVSTRCASGAGGVGGRIAARSLFMAKLRYSHHASRIDPEPTDRRARRATMGCV